ncbi:MAG: hypothetical protein RMI83_03110 [Desulfurococcaceae archaeon]|nr:hypothetical protein [Sulfolobales archaeon]MDW8170075.1 hypothetical protein [Desulfurococcaceae archaeon]
MIKDLKHIIVFFNEDLRGVDLSKLIINVMKSLLGSGKLKGLYIWIVSDTGPVKYIEYLKNFLLSNIAYSVVLQYAGSSQVDFLKLASKLKDLEPVIVVKKDLASSVRSACINCEIIEV